MKKFTVLLVVFLLVQVLSVNAFFTEKLTIKDIGVQVHFGYDKGEPILRKWCPVDITLENKTDDTIKGEVELRLKGEDSRSISADFVLPGKVTKKITLYMFYQGETTYNVYIHNTKGKVVYETVTRYVESKIDTSSNLVGLLTDNKDSLNYISKLEYLDINANVPRMGKDNENTSYIVEKLDSNNFPTDKNAMSSFNVLIINDFDLTALTSEQTSCLDYYIKTGGTIITGTGHSANTALKGLKDYVDNQNDVKVEQKNIKLIIGSIKGGSRLSVADIESDDLKSIVLSDDTTVVYRHNKYNLYFLSFSLDDKQFTEWASNYSYINELLFTKTDALESPGIINSNNDINDALKLMNENFMPSSIAIFVIVFVYILLVAPVSYFILKKSDRRELMWVVIPGVVVVFSAAIFMYGYFARGGGDVASTVTVIELNPYSDIQKPAYVASTVMTASNGTYGISYSSNGLYGPSLLKRGYQYYYRGESEEPYQNYKQGAKPSIKLTGAKMWSFIDTEGYIEVDNYGRFETKIDSSEVDKGIIKISVKNNTGHDLKYVVLSVYNEIKTLEQFAYLDTAEFSFDINNQNGSSYELSVLNAINTMIFNNATTGYNSYNNYGHLKGPKDNVEANILWTVLNSTGRADEFSATPSMFITGFVEKTDGINLKINGKRPNKKTDYTLVRQKVNMSDSNISVSDGMYNKASLIDHLSNNIEYNEKDNTVRLNDASSYAIYEVQFNFNYEYYIELDIATELDEPVKVEIFDPETNTSVLYVNKNSSGKYEINLSQVKVYYDSVDKNRPIAEEAGYFLFKVSIERNGNNAVVIQNVRYSLVKGAPYAAKN